MRLSVLTFCALLSWPLTAAEATYKLVDRWQVNFGRGQDRATYHTAVCPDGTFYLSDSYGRVAVIDARGKVTSRKFIREFVTARSLACDAESRLYLADPANIWVMRAGAVVSRVHSDVRITAIVPASDGSVYASGVSRASSLPLHHIDPEGRAMNSFGIELGGQFNRMYPRWEGHLVWQEALGRLLYVPSRRAFEIQAYRADGSAIGVFGIEGRHILPVRVSETSEPTLGMSTGVAPLPHNGIAVQRDVADWNRRASRMLEIYDASLRRVGTAMSDVRNLAGGAADGDLYFTTLSPRGLQVFRVGLVKRLSL